MVENLMLYYSKYRTFYQRNLFTVTVVHNFVARNLEFSTVSGHCAPKISYLTLSVKKLIENRYKNFVT